MYRVCSVTTITIFIHSIGMCRMRRFLAVFRSFFHSALLHTLSFHPFPPTSIPSSLTSSCHLFLGLPLSLVVSKFIYKTNAAIWFNKICRINHLRPKYISLKINGHKQQDRRTEASAIKYHITQEIKFQYKKKQHLNQQLYDSHLECAHHYGGMWQHIHMIVDEQLRNNMEAQYRTLNKKLDALSNSNSKYNKQKQANFNLK